MTPIAQQADDHIQGSHHAVDLRVPGIGDQRDLHAA